MSELCDEKRPTIGDRSCSKNVHLFDIFKKYYGVLAKKLCACLNTVTNELYARNLISDEVQSQVISSQDSDQTKASKLLLHVKNEIQCNPAKLLELIDVLKEEPFFDEITKEILGKIEEGNRLFFQEQTAQVATPLSSPKMSETFSIYREYLQSYYHNDPVACDDKLSIAPCSQFINLALVNKYRPIDKSDMFTKSTLHVGVDKILAFKTPLEMDAILTPDSRFVLVEGPPGIGKSTFCWELCRKWDTLKSLRDYKIVLQLKLRERRVQNATSLNEIFYHRNPKMCNGVVDEVFECNGEGVLFILDGFDEMPTSVVHDDNNLIMEIIRGKCLPKATRLITSRPSALHYKRCFPREHRHIEILGFTDECKLQYAESAFKSKPDVLIHFKKFIVSNPIINSLIYIPINCAITVQVYEDIRRNMERMPRTMTQLYTLIIPVLIKRHMIEKGKWDKDSSVPSNLNNLPMDVITELKRISELAYRGLFKVDNQLVFTDVDIGIDFQHLGLLKESKEMYLHEGAKASYSFLHLSIQEFLAAWHVSHDTKLIEQTISFSLDNMLVGRAHLEAYVQFLAGMIGCKEFPISRLYLFGSKLFACLFEAQDHPCSPSELLSSCTCSIRVNLQTPLDMYIFGYTLVHAHIQCHLEVSTSFDMLVSSLADHKCSNGEALGSIVEIVMRHIDIDKVFTSSVLQLQRCLPQSILALRNDWINTSDVSGLAKVIPGLHNLQSIAFTFHESSEDDYLVYQALKSVQRIDLNLFNITMKGLHALTSTITNSKTLKCVALALRGDRPFPFIIPWSRCVEAILSSSTVRDLDMDCIIFKVNCSFPSNMKYFHFSMKSCYYFIVPDVIVLDCICCIANMYKDSTNLNLTMGMPVIRPRFFHDFITIFNSSLHCNLTPGRLIISLRVRFEPCHLHFLSHSLRQAPDKPLQNLRRSKSLSDLTTVYRNDQQNVFSKRKTFADHHHSCPDLLEIQSLHNMHPLLRETLSHEVKWLSDLYDK